MLPAVISTARAGTKGGTGAGTRVRVPTIALVFLTAALMGGNYVAIKSALAYSTPVALTAMRAGLGGIALLGFALLRGERPPRSRDAWKAVALVSLCITTASSVLLVLGTKRVPSGLAALLSATMPLFAALLAFVFLRERPRREARFGLALGVVGAAVLASPAIDGKTSLSGVLIILCATFAWALGVVAQKKLDLSEVSAVMFVACQLLLSAVCIGALALAVEGTGGVHPGWGLAVPLGYCAILSMAIPFSLMATVIRRAPAVQGAAIAYLIPMFGVLASWLVRGETLQPAELLGGALVVLGVVLVNRQRSVAPVRDRADRQRAAGQ